MSSTWFRRNKKGISTETKEKKEAPDGLWHKCPECRTTITLTDLSVHLYVCPNCDFHSRIDAKEYFEIIFDEGRFTTGFENLKPIDKLEFVDVKPYKDRLQTAQKQT